MQFLEWNNKNVGDYNVFMIITKAEAQKIVDFFDNELAWSCSFPQNLGDEEYYYFLNTELKTITPMPFLSFAFGGMYNGYPPYGEEIENFSFELDGYELTFHQEDYRIN